MDDPFGVADLRERVLEGWAAAPARFREDANAEEDHALGGYRDRVIVELAQNAADAALRAGIPGRLTLTLSGGVLTAANTGAPLDAAGVEALSTLRASAKRDEHATAGRFGVGFAAVVAVSDEPSISSVTGAVGWSAARTRAAAAEMVPGELARRSGHVPVLRLPFAVPGEEIPDGYATVVRLPLMDAAAEDLIRRLLDEVGPALMLGLPALETIEIHGSRTLTAARDGDGGVTIDGARWRSAEAHGVLGPELLAGRPVEERSRPAWWLRWAIPEKGLPADVPAVLHAPTVSDEPIGLPALLLGSFPLAPDRRHVAPGALTDFLADRAAECYADLLKTMPADRSLLDLVPGPMAKSALDAAIRRGIVARLPEVALLPLAEDQELRVRGRDAIVLDGPPELIGVLADVLPGLLPDGWPAGHPALGTLGVRRMGLAEVVDAFAALDRPPEWWRLLYDALSESFDADALAGLPVPLADGRTVRGARGLLIAADGVDPAPLAPLGLRFVHPDAVHPLLSRLGAADAGPRTVLADPATRAAVAASFDEEDPEPIANAVLSLVAEANPAAGELPWLAELALPGDDGEVYPAGELLLPGAPLEEVVADDAPFGVVASAVYERWGLETLEAVGALWSFSLVRTEDVTEPDLHLDGEEEWAAELAGRFGVAPTILELVAVRDLELVERWPQALALLARPPLRAAVVDPLHVLTADGRRVAVPPYTAWWLRRHPVLDGARPADLRLPGTDPLLAGLYDLAPADLDPGLVRALGVRTSLEELLGEPGGPADLLGRLADPDRMIDRPGEVWRALALRDLTDVPPPSRVRAFVGGSPEVVPAADAIVVDRPYLLEALAEQPLILVPLERAVAVADALELALASEEVPGVISSHGVSRPMPAVVRRVLPEAPSSYVHHDALVVDGNQVSWWAAGDTVHASGFEGLARGVAWVTGRWPDRLLAAAALRDPESVPMLLAETEFD